MSIHKIVNFSDQRGPQNFHQLTQNLFQNRPLDDCRRLDQKSKNKEKLFCELQQCKGSQKEQVLFYKEKAHQSFMQVIQIQQLHEEQIQQLKEEYEQKIAQLQKDLRQKKEQMINYLHRLIEIFKKNSNQNLVELQKKIQNEKLDLIEYNQSNITPFDESTLLAYKDFLSQKQPETKIQSLRQNIIFSITKEIRKHLPNPDFIIKLIKKELDCIFDYLKDLNQQFTAKRESYQTLLKKYQQIDSNHNKLMFALQAHQNDSAIAADSLKKLKQEKITLIQKNTDLQRKILEIQKQRSNQETNKQECFKISLRQNTMTSLAFKDMVSSERHIFKNVRSRWYGIKSNLDVLERNNQNDFRESNNQQNIKSPIHRGNQLKNQESFDVKDLIAEINRNQKNARQPIDKKKTQLNLSIPIEGKVRRKSFGN